MNVDEVNERMNIVTPFHNRDDPMQKHGRLVSDDMATQDFVIGPNKQFAKAVFFFHRTTFGRVHKGNRGGNVRCAVLLQFFFRRPNTGYLRKGKDSVRHRPVVNRFVTVLADLSAKILALEIRRVGEHVATRNVPHRIDAFGRGAQTIVGLDVAVCVWLEVRILDADVVAVRHAADTKKQRLAVAFRGGAIGVLDRNMKTRTVMPSGCNRRVERHRYAGGKTFHKQSANLVVLALQELIAPDDQLRVDAYSMKRGAEFKNDVAAANDGYRFRHFTEFKDLIAGPIGHVERGALWATAG